MSRINVRNQIFTVQDFVTWMKAGSLELSPSFQRRDVWRPNDRSYFLDTVVRGMPTSAIYIREKRELGSLDSIREVVDGQQRIRTLIGYVEPELLDDATNQPTVILSKHNDDPKICNRLFPDGSVKSQGALRKRSWGSRRDRWASRRSHLREQRTPTRRKEPPLLSERHRFASPAAPAEVLPQLVERRAEARRRREAPEAAHRVVPLLHRAMVLLHEVV